MMKRLAYTVAVCVLVCLLSFGCAQFNTSKYFGFLSKQHDQSAPVEAPAAAQVCVLDPTAQVSDIIDVPRTAPEASPVAEVPETVFDFGELTEDLEFVHKFSVKNAGKSVLNIKKVVPG